MEQRKGKRQLNQGVRVKRTEEKEKRADRSAERTREATAVRAKRTTESRAARGAKTSLGQKLKAIHGKVRKAVHESRESAQLLPGGMADEIGRCIVHELHHAAGVAHDGASVAPGDRRSEETGDLPVVGVGETMRHADGVGFDEFGPVIAVVPPLEQFAQLAA